MRGGPVVVMRTLYRRGRGEERTLCPLELRAGIIEGRWTPLAARQAAFVVAHLTPQEGEDLFRELGNMTPSKSSLDRLPKQLSEHWEGERTRFEAALRAQERVPSQAVTVAVSLDGVMVPMKDGARAQKRDEAKAKDKRTRGPAGYSEVGCTEEIEAAFRQRPNLTLVKLADGAKDNWTYLSDALPPGVELVDFYHACEHLKSAFEAAYGENSSKSKAQFEKYRHILRDEVQGVEKVIRALAHLKNTHPRKTKLSTKLLYFRHHRHRMGYAEAQAQNLPIGSGVVEAARVRP